MTNFEELANKLEVKLSSISNFKIGKTERNIVDHFREAYAKEYNKYEIVAYSKNLNTIEDFEMYLLQRFQSLQSCDNKFVDDRELEEAENYILYLMYND